MDEEFCPPRCPNPACRFHLPTSPYRDYRPWGSYSTRRSGKVPRFRCTACGQCFSAQTFRVDYWLKRPYPREEVARRLASHESLSALGRAWGLSGKAVKLRIARGRRLALSEAGFPSEPQNRFQ